MQTFFPPKYIYRLRVPPNLPFNEYQDSSSGVKRPGTERDHSPSSAGAKNEWSYTSIPPTCLHDVDREKLYFHFILESGKSETSLNELGSLDLDISLRGTEGPSKRPMWIDTDRARTHLLFISISFFPSLSVITYKYNMSVNNTTLYLYTIKIIYCQGDMFRLLLGHLQAL